MANSSICVRIDENLKEQFDKLCSELGLSMSAAINIFAKAVVRHKGFPFDVSINTPNSETIKAIKDVEQGIGLSKSYSDVDEMFKDLNA
ncbi:MAG: type II toxin-antitoxin system RelB/DinJ family antitoxin [Candidatus Gastranaerophilales bacterium]|nr:type II toxin-antitoxin system RelB/DinJ family antitoxin [Candidatus Gastranaerophilales bacterium]